MGWVIRLVLVMAAIAIGWWILADRPSPFSGRGPAADALRAYIEAAQRSDCATVAAAVTERTRQLVAAQARGRAQVERSLCEYSPAPAKLGEFETTRIRVEATSGSTARVSASFTYDRFFGFFGRGRSRHTYTLVRVDGRWLVDLSESLDPESTPNQNRRAMFLVQQVYTVIGNILRSTGSLTDDQAAIRRTLPGFTFPEMRSGVATAAAPAEIPFIALGPEVACISLRSMTGTLAMVKMLASGTGSTYQYGTIPATCDGAPLSRPYYGASSGIR